MAYPALVEHQHQHKHQTLPRDKECFACVFGKSISHRKRADINIYLIQIFINRDFDLLLFVLHGLTELLGDPLLALPSNQPVNNLSIGGLDWMINECRDRHAVQVLCVSNFYAHFCEFPQRRKLKRLVIVVCE